MNWVDFLNQDMRELCARECIVNFSTQSKTCETSPYSWHLRSETLWTLALRHGLSSFAALHNWKLRLSVTRTKKDAESACAMGGNDALSRFKAGNLSTDADADNITVASAQPTGPAEEGQEEESSSRGESSERIRDETGKGAPQKSRSQGRLKKPTSRTGADTRNRSVPTAPVRTKDSASDGGRKRDTTCASRTSSPADSCDKGLLEAGSKRDSAPSNASPLPEVNDASCERSWPVSPTGEVTAAAAPMIHTNASQADDVTNGQPTATTHPSPDSNDAVNVVAKDDPCISHLAQDAEVIKELGPGSNGEALMQLQRRYRWNDDREAYQLFGKTQRCANEVPKRYRGHLSSPDGRQ